MSFTRLAGAWSSAAFFENRTFPCASRRSTASALSGNGRALWLTAHEGPASASDRTMARKRRAGTFPPFYPQSAQSPNKTRSNEVGGQKLSANRALELFRWPEAGRPARHDVHRLTGLRVLASAGFSSSDSEGAEADEGDGLSPLEGGTDGRQ